MPMNHFDNNEVVEQYIDQEKYNQANNCTNLFQHKEYWETNINTNWIAVSYVDLLRTI
jgi:uncharacterized protein Usg